MKHNEKINIKYTSFSSQTNNMYNYFKNNCINTKIKFGYAILIVIFVYNCDIQ